MMRGHRATSQFTRVWRWPLLLALLTMFGLLSALLGEGGVWWALSWIALLTPLGVIAWAILRPIVLSKRRRRCPAHES